MNIKLTDATTKELVIVNTDNITHTSKTRGISGHWWHLHLTSGEMITVNECYTDVIDALYTPDPRVIDLGAGERV